MNDHTVAALANHLVHYHRRSFVIRSMGLRGEIDPPICGEMENLSKRLLGTYTATDRLMQMSTLQEIIKLGRQELQDISRAAATAARADLYLDSAKSVYAEIEAASKLMEML